MVNSHSSEKCEEMNKNPPLEYDLRKYLLLLAILVATVTYAAGFNPPGGVWQETEAGHLAGDSIIRDTNYPRYLVFFYCNAAAFALSIVVIILIFILAILHEKINLWISVIPLRAAMLLDLVGLIGAYAAGTSRGVMKGKNAWVLILIFVYMVLQIVLTSLPGNMYGQNGESSCRAPLQWQCFLPGKLGRRKPQAYCRSKDGRVVAHISSNTCRAPQKEAFRRAPG